MSSNDDPKRKIDHLRRAAADPAVGEEAFVRMIEEGGSRPRREDLVSIEELAAERGKSIRTLRRWNNRPDAPRRVKRKRQLMYRRADLERWLARCENQPIPTDHDPAEGD